MSTLSIYQYGLTALFLLELKKHKNKKITSILIKWSPVQSLNDEP